MAPSTRRPALLLALLLAASACSRRGDTAVVGIVDADQVIRELSQLRATVTARGVKKVIEIVKLSDAQRWVIPPARTFAINISGTTGDGFDLHVDAEDALGRVLATADGAGKLRPGERVDVALELMLAAGGTLVLRRAQLTTTGPLVPAPGARDQLKEHGLEIVEPMCARTLCVHGGLTP